MQPMQSASRDRAVGASACAECSQAAWRYAAMQGGVHRGTRWGVAHVAGSGAVAAALRRVRYIFFSWDHSGGARRHWAALIWLFIVTASRAAPQPLHAVCHAVSPCRCPILRHPHPPGARSPQIENIVL